MSYQQLLQNFRPEEYGSSILISFEGIEGSGKSTQVKLFRDFLARFNRPIYQFREPGGTVFGENLRKAILESPTPIAPLAEAHLFAAARAQLLNEKILPHLKNETCFVILDRYIDSSIAYQGSARGLGIETVLSLHQHYPLTVMPDLTFYLRIDLETSLHRQQQRGNYKDYFEKENQKFYNQLIAGYDQAQELFPKRITIIDGAQSENQVQKTIQNHFTNHFQEKLA
jgi:dTMP kinase